MSDLCLSFLESSASTWNLLGKAAKVGFQIGEEGITDLLVLEWKSRLRHALVCEQHTKPREGVTGADWEWWFLDGTLLGTGFRVQAKVLDLRSNHYEHLHYSKRRRKPSRDEYQSEVLAAACAKADPPIAPLYCLYSWWQDATYPILGTTGPRGLPQQFGCGLLSIDTVRALRSSNLTRDLKTVRPFLAPLHELVCLRSIGESEGSLPVIVAKNWNARAEEQRNYASELRRQPIDEDFVEVPQAQPTEALPSYVRQAATHREVRLPEHLRGLVLFATD